MLRRIPTALMIFATLSLTATLSGCGYNTLQQQSEQIKANWSDVLNQYQRRADLIPNLVNTVKGFAAQEKSVLVDVTQARARAGSIQATPALLNDPQAFHKFEQAQGQLTGALSRLLVVSERYPDLKSNQNFLALQSQLEGTENRIAVARRDYIQAVQKYNTDLVTFPGRIWHWMLYNDMKPHASFKASAPNAEQAPQVSF